MGAAGGGSTGGDRAPLAPLLDPSPQAQRRGGLYPCRLCRGAGAGAGGGPATLGEALWAQLQRQGYLDVPSTYQPGLTYRLRVGRRIEVRCAPGVRSPWSAPYLCINPTYPLPEEEFFAQLYLYVRDREDIVRRVAAPQPWDQPLGRTF